VLAGATAAWVILVGNKRSPEQLVSAQLAGTEVKVTYCRPFKKGRLIFGEEAASALVPYGKYWRLGANASTEISFSKDVQFGDKPVQAGTYRMYAIPGAQSWTVALNSELGQWGALEPDYTKDVTRIEVPVNANPELEQFTLTLTPDSAAVNMDFAWDQTIVRVPIGVQK
ncbi:MAG: DUF2911 domain-containing protein, partial [Cyclobacteriaceae bacterium]|nr:DUF2911 domain-containing protein [Cyclobacteriaceae bacterium]